MKIVALSDTHGNHDQVEVPECDVLVHAGDFSHGSRAAAFLNWLERQPAKHKVYIAGNHDRMFADHICKAAILTAYPTLHYLEDSSVTIDGVKFYGSPFTPIYGRYAFMLPHAQMHEKWASIPDDTDVLITHGPPYGIFDVSRRTQNRAGCHSLRRRVREVRPKLHIFGHIHENTRTRKFTHTTYANVAICNDVHGVVAGPTILTI